MSQNLQDLFDNTAPRQFVDKSKTVREQWQNDPARRDQVAQKVREHHKQAPYTEEQKLARSIHQQLLMLSGLHVKATGGYVSHRKGTKLTEEQRQAYILARGSKGCKPIQTPQGRFDSKRAAADAMTQAGIANASNKLKVWLKSDPTNYYYL
jgi:hypothetical protein